VPRLYTKQNTMKKTLTLLTSAMFIIATFTSCRNDNNDNEPPFSLNRISATLVVGDTLHLSANASNVTWSSSTDAVSVINGMVIADTVGVARITATTQDGNTHTCNVAVVGSQGNCNFDTPGWGNTLGTVSFHTNQIWTIEGYGISQIWSDAITATNCQKTTFNGGDVETQSFNADCRSNPDFSGDLFSWCAVVRFADVLCPYPWRVPTQQDFINLDIAMGGVGARNNANNNLDPQFITDNYINRWGGAFGGFNFSDGAFHNQDFAGYYWSQSEHTTNHGGVLTIGSNGSVNPQGSQGGFLVKPHGFTLRCVLDCFRNFRAVGTPYW